MLLKICLIITLITITNSTFIKHSDRNSQRNVLIGGVENLEITRNARCDPGVVLSSLVTYFSNIILVEWRAPASCVSGFIVSLNDEQTEVAFDDSIEWYNRLYEGLESCTAFSVGVIVIGEDEAQGEPTITEVVTLAPFRMFRGPSQITGTYFQFLDNSWTVSWNPAALEGNCITGYDLNIWNQDSSSTVDVVVQESFYEFTPYIPCMSYSMQIIANIDATTSNPVFDYVTLTARVTEPPTLVGLVVNDRIVDITLSLESFTTNACEVTSLRINCIINDTAILFFSIPYEDSVSRPEAVIRISQLALNASYVCDVSVTNSGGMSELSESITFATE